MEYTVDEIRQFTAEEDVKFLRLAFCDIFGSQKNISILPDELDRAFSYGIAFDASAVPGFGDEVHSDLFLHPDSSTLCMLPWRPDHGRVARMFCHVLRPDGAAFEADCRALLRQAVADAEALGIRFSFGTEMEFYLFRRDENGEATHIPYDNAGYMDIAPEDKGENVRREICLTLEQMARDLGYNYTYLSAYFNQRLHTGFQDFVNQYRVSHAAMLLQGSSIPVTQVAEQCGFGTIRSFNRVFLKSLGMSPSAFRKQNR